MLVFGGADDVEFIAYYLPRYRQFAEGGKLFGAYGPRLFNACGVDQISNITSLLKTKAPSRQAVIQLFDAGDIVEEHEDVPCTCTLQFLVRGSGLELVTYMRSNDAYIGLPPDVFCFTMLQEILARELGVDVGMYKHLVGGLHIYETDIPAVGQFLEEGWQSTQEPMPPMPRGNPWPSVKALLNAEEQIRTGIRVDDVKLDGIDGYWADLIRLLQVFRCKKDNDSAAVKALREHISSLYFPFIDRMAQP